MALSATFVTDFSRFYAAVQEASVRLEGFDATTKQVGASLTAMTEKFSGKKILEEGAQIDRLFGSMKDLSLLTTAELRTLGATAGEAVEKMTKLGIDVPKNLQMVADATKNSKTRTDELKEGMGALDKTLSTMGINLSGPIGSINELTGLIGKTTTQLGTFGTVAAGAGAAMAGWQFGRFIAGWLGTDEAIGKATASLMGWGDLTGQTAGAKQDVITKAILNGAAATITYADAIKYNNEQEQERLIKVDTSAARFATWNAELEKVAKAGHLAQLNEELESQAFKHEELAKRYGISEGALNLLVRQQELAEEQTKEENKAVDDLFKAWSDGEKIMTDFHTKAHAVAMKALAEERAEQSKALTDRNKEVIDGFKQIQTIQDEYTDYVKKQTLSETDYKVSKIKEWETETINAFKGTKEQAETYAVFVHERAQQQIDDLTRVKGGVTAVGDEYSRMYKEATEGVLVIGQSAAEATAKAEEAAGKAKEAGEAAKAGMDSFHGSMVLVAQDMTDLNRQLSTFYDQFSNEFGSMFGASDIGVFGSIGGRRQPGISYGGLPTRQAGGPVHPTRAYVVGERGPELFRPSSAGTIVPSLAGGGGTVVHNTFYVNGSVQDIARPLMDELTRMMKQTRQWPSAT